MYTLDFFLKLYTPAYFLLALYLFVYLNGNNEDSFDFPSRRNQIRSFGLYFTSSMFLVDSRVRLTVILPTCSKPERV